MTFEQQLRAAIIPLGVTRSRAADPGDAAAALVARYAPHLLKRFAALAGSLQSTLRADGQGVIVACRNGFLGYRTAEFRSRNLHIVLDASEGEACVRWEANGEIGMHVLTSQTAERDLDAVILAAVSAFVRGQPNIAAASQTPGANPAYTISNGHRIEERLKGTEIGHA